MNFRHNKIILTTQLREIFYLPHIDKLLDSLLSDSLYYEVLSSFWIKRLFEIPFLGGLSYIDRKDETQTRGHHSLGVALLALYYAQANEMEKRDERICVLSALLHDIHHLPFAHTMELAFKNEESFMPHHYDRIIIKENSANERGESLDEIIGKYGINFSKEFLFLRKSGQRPLLFKSTHNLDTLEGILRVNHSYQLSINRDIPRKIINDMIACSHNKSGKCQSNLEAFDEFWNMKNRVYANVIYDDRKIFFERILSFYLYDLCKKKKLMKDIYKLTDKDFFKIYPELREKINALWQYINTSNDNWHRLLVLNDKKVAEAKSKANQAPIIFEFTTRQFKIKRKVTNIGITTLGELRKRYECKTKRSVLFLDPFAVKNIENIIDFPISQRLEKLGNVRDNILI